MEVTPVGERVLIQRVEPEERKGSIIIPDTMKEKPQQGIIIAQSDDAERKFDRDQKVLFGKYSGTEIEFEDEQYLLISTEDILAILK